MSDTGNPVEQYERRLTAREKSLAELTRWEGRIANTRLLVFIAGAVVVWFGFWTHRIHPAWIAPPVLAFVVLVVVHERVLRAIARAASGVEYYSRGLARMADRPSESDGDTRDYAPKDHPYAADLDLFGQGSLFQLLSTAQTRAGAAMLADWLCKPAAPDEVRGRQGAVAELRPRIDLREELAYQGRGMRTTVFPERIAEWAGAAPVFTARVLPAAAFAISGTAILTGIGGCYGMPTQPFVLSLAALGVFYMLTSRRVRRVLSSADEPRRELEIVGRVLVHLERERFEGPYLAALQADLRDGPLSASRAILRLCRILTMREAALNMLFAPVAALTLWDYHFARAVEGWRRKHGASVSRWLECVGRLEALCSLSAYAYEHPLDPFPTIETEGPAFRGDGIGHPLLPASLCVRNDVALDSNQTLLIVSGSNMSGKTVLLRTVGINTVLAFAGAPVRARALSLSPLALGATLSVHDAIQDGVSRFYAEIKRIRALMDIARGPMPLLFLMDEIFHGTNSWDRRVGAHAVLRSLVDAGAIGIVTTHDLAITDLADSFDGRATNVHFEDHLEEDRLVFDFTLRPGVVKKSNALDLMRAIGLDVECPGHP